MASAELYRERICQHVSSAQDESHSSASFFSLSLLSEVLKIISSPFQYQKYSLSTFSVSVVNFHLLFRFVFIWIFDSK